MLNAVLLMEVTFAAVWWHCHPSKPYSKDPPFSKPSKTAQPILHIACGAHSVLSNVRSVVFQSPAIFSPDSRAAKAVLWRLLSRLHQAGLTLSAMAEASGFRRPEPDSQAPAHIPRLCSCSWNLVQHIASLQRKKSLTLSKIDVSTSTVWLSFTHSSMK